jgi:DNA-binding XRE family transcriptional regulator
MEYVDKNRFKEIREAMEISQRDAALILGLSVDTVQDWEQSRRGTPQWALNAIEQLQTLGKEKIQSLLDLEQEQFRPKAKFKIFNYFRDLVESIKTHSSKTPLPQRVYGHLIELVKFDLQREQTIPNSVLKYLYAERAIEILAELEYKYATLQDVDGPDIKGPPTSELDAFLLWRELDRFIYRHSDLERYERFYLAFLWRLKEGSDFAWMNALFKLQEIKDVWEAVREARKEIYRLIRRHLISMENKGESEKKARRFRKRQ